MSTEDARETVAAYRRALKVVSDTGARALARSTHMRDWTPDAVQELAVHIGPGKRMNMRRLELSVPMQSYVRARALRDPGPKLARETRALEGA